MADIIIPNFEVLVSVPFSLPFWPYLVPGWAEGRLVYNRVWFRPGHKRKYLQDAIWSVLGKRLRTWAEKTQNDLTTNMEIKGKWKLCLSESVKVFGSQDIAAEGVFFLSSIPNACIVTFEAATHPRSCFVLCYWILRVPCLEILLLSNCVT